MNKFEQPSAGDVAEEKSQEGEIESTERDVGDENVHFFRFRLIQLAMRQMANGREVESGIENNKKYSIVPTTALANPETGEVFDESRLKFLSQEIREQLKTITLKVKIGTQVKGSITEILWEEGFSKSARKIIEDSVEVYNQLNRA